MMKNTKETKKTIVGEALMDFEVLLKEADKSAREKIIKSMPDKFDNILSEEIKKLTNKKSEKEPLSEGKPKELVNNKNLKNKPQINEEFNLTNENMGDVEDVYNKANLEDEFQVESDEYNNDFNLDEIEQELLQMDSEELPEEPQQFDSGAKPEEIEQEIDFDSNDGVIPDFMPEANENDPYTKFKSLYEQMGNIVNDMEQEKAQKEYMTEFEGHLTEMFGEDHNLDEAVKTELYEKFEARKKGDPFGEKKLNEDESEPFNNTDKSHGEDDPYNETDKKNIGEMKNVGGKSGPDMNKGNKDNAGGPTQSTINEDDIEIEDEVEVDALDEKLGVGYSDGKVNAGRLPGQGAENRDRAGHSRNRPQWSNESVNKKMKSLFQDKKKISKKLNEYRNGLIKSNKIVEQYKNGLQKYRNHLNEMAIFNTNLSHVNNILVESIENKEDVKGVINKFKKVKSIDESKKVFNTVITEMKKNNKEVISEQVENKLNKVIGESSSVNGDKSKVITESAYKNDEHIKKLKNLITYQLGK